MSESNTDLGFGMTSLRTRHRMLERLTQKGIQDVRILEAMRDIPRHLFLDEALSSRAYEDLALPIGHQQTISQPYIVARMTEIVIQHKKLETQPLTNTLEIGTGCGYQTAILGRFSKSVDSLERIKALHDKAMLNLKKLKIKNTRLIYDDGSKLQKNSDNYDAILVTAAPQEVPNYLLEKLCLGGRLVAPVGNQSGQKLIVVERIGKKDYETKELEDVLFVPFLGGLVD